MNFIYKTQTNYMNYKKNVVQINWESKSLEGTQGVQFNALGNRISNIYSYTTVFRVKQLNAKREIV